MMQFFRVFFEVKESGETVILVIKGQLLPLRLPKGHLKVIFGHFRPCFKISAIFRHFKNV